MKLINLILSVLIGIILFQIFWPLLVVFICFLLIYIIYINYKVKSTIRKAEKEFENSNINNNNDNYYYYEDNNSNVNDIIDVEYSERDISNDD